MGNVLKTEFKILFSRREFKLALLFSIFIVCGHFVSMYRGFYGADISDVFKATDFFIGGGVRSIYSDLFFMFLLPLVSAFSYADMLLVEKSNNTHVLYQTRNGKYQYYFAKIVVVMISGALVILGPWILSFFLSFIAAPVNNDITHVNLSSYYYVPLAENVIFPRIYVAAPYVYSIIFVIIPSVFGALFALTSFAISLLKKANKLAVIFIPTVLVQLTMYVMANMGLTNFEIMRYFKITDSITGLSPMIMFGYMLLLIIIPSIIIYTKMREKDVL